VDGIMWMYNSIISVLNYILIGISLFFSISVISKTVYEICKICKKK
jgi:hypothetical protein